MRISFNEKDLSGGDRIPEGEHEVTVTSMTQESSKAGNPQLVAVLTDRYGRTLKEFFPISENGKWKIARFAIAAGFTKEELAAKGLNIPSLTGRKVLLKKAKTGKTRTVDNKQYDDYSQEYFPVLSGAAPEPASTEEEMPF